MMGIVQTGLVDVDRAEYELSRVTELPLVAIRPTTESTRHRHLGKLTLFELLCSQRFITVCIKGVRNWACRRTDRQWHSITLTIASCLVE